MRRPALVASRRARRRQRALEPAELDPRLPALQTEERDLSLAVGDLTFALESADDVPELAARLRERSHRRRAVRVELAARRALTTIDPNTLDADLRAIVSNPREELEANAPRATYSTHVLVWRPKMGWRLVR